MHGTMITGGQRCLHILRPLAICAVTLVFGALLVKARPVAAEDQKLPTSDNVRKTIERALVFLKNDALKWRKEHECATCHHGTLTVWALNEAQQQGFAVDAMFLADMTKWTKDRWLANVDKPRDTRPGFSMVSTPQIYLALADQLLPERGVLSADERGRVAASLIRHQEAGGEWDWSAAPAKNRPPPFFESNEVATLLASMALDPRGTTDPAQVATRRESREKAATWLSKNPPNDTTQAAALRLMVRVRAGSAADQLQADIEQLLGRRNPDGGWGQLKDRPSDAYATGQVLYVLSLAGVKSDRQEVQRAVAFLVATQREEGSWPMTQRVHDGVVKTSVNLVPITYFGSVWGTLGLLRSMGK